MDTIKIDVLSRRGALACVLAAMLAGCATPLPPAQPSPQPQSNPELAAFKAVLHPGHVVPPVNSTARGELVGVLNRTTGLLRFRLQFEGLSGPVRSAAFHSPAMEGEVAAPTLAIGRSLSSPFEARAILSPRQSANLLSGQWYVELRTERYPGGELRGQMIEQAP